MFLFQSFKRKPLKQGDPELSHLLTKAKKVLVGVMMMMIVVVGVWLVVGSGCDGADGDDSGHGGRGVMVMLQMW